MVKHHAHRRETRNKGGPPPPSIYPQWLVELRQATYWILEEPDASSDVPKIITKGVACANVFMILVSLVSLIMETMPMFKETTPEVVWKVLEVVSTGVFTIEYVLRFWVCDVYGASAVDWACRTMNICDLLAILPVYIEAFASAETDIKFLRVLRVIRLFKIGRYSQGVRVMNAALANSFSALYILNFLFFICSVCFASMIYFTEKLSCPDFTELSLQQFLEYNQECGESSIASLGTCCAYMCQNVPNVSGDYPLCKGEWQEEIAVTFGRRLAGTADSSQWKVEAMHELEMDSVVTGMWWAAVTMTTVGYGDIVPKHWTSKIVASTAMLTGMLIIAMPFAIVGTKFSEAAVDCAEDYPESEDEDGETTEDKVQKPESDGSRPDEQQAVVPAPRSKSQYSKGMKTSLEKLQQDLHKGLELKKEIMQLQMLRDNLWTSVEHSMAVLAFEGSISFSNDMIEGPWIKDMLPQKQVEADKSSKYCELSLGFIKRQWGVRRAAIYITSHWVFETFVLLAIVANSFILAVQNYYPGQEDHWGNILQRESELPFTILFTLECAIKVLACGFVAHPTAYIRDPWNWIDFTVVIASLFSLLNLKAFEFLRSARVLRPLRSLTALPGIRNLFRTIILSLPGLKDVILLAMFLLVMFGVLGLHFWTGLLHRSCRLTPEPLHFTSDATNVSCKGLCFDNSSLVSVSLAGKTLTVNSSVVFESFCATDKDCAAAWQNGNPYYLWPMDTNEARFCGSRQCQSTSLSAQPSATVKGLLALGLADSSNQVGTSCGSPLASDPTFSPYAANSQLSGINLDNWDKEVQGEDRNFGLTNFDNIGNAFLVVFQSVTLEGWSDIMFMIQDAHGPEMAFIYFLMLILVGAFFLINVILAIIWDAFLGVEEASETRKAEEAEELRLREQKAKEVKAHAVEAGYARASTRFRTSFIDASAAGGEAAKGIFGTLVMKRNQANTSAIMQEVSDYGIVNLARRLARNNAFNAVIMFLIIVNVLVLSLDTYPIGLLDRLFEQVLNYLFNAAFLIEFIVLHLAVGPLVYWSDNAMAFDGFVVICSMADLISELSGGGASSVLATLRAFRMLRIIKLAQKFHSMKVLLKAGVATLMSMGDFVALLTLIICVFALIGQSFFAGKFMFDPDDNSWVPPEEVEARCPMGDGQKPICVPRAHFDTFWWSFMTIFSILTGENWNAVMYDGMRSAGRGAIVYFLMVVLFGNFVILNLFLAILMKNFDDERTKLQEEMVAEAAEQEEEEAPKNDSSKKQAWGSSEEEKPSRKSDIATSALAVIPNSSGPAMPESPRKSLGGGRKSLVVGADGEPVRLTARKSQLELEIEDADARVKERLGSRTCFIFSEDNPIRQTCIALVAMPRFDQFIMSLIGISSLMMALENPLRDPNSTLVKALEVASAIFTVIFLGELVVKMIAMGVLFGHGDQPAYLRSFENIMDFVIVIVSVIDTITTSFMTGAGGGIMSVLKVFRVIRMLRPLRLISRNKNLKVVIKTVAASIPELRNLLLFSSLFFFIFGLVNVGLYKGSFYSCKDSSLGDVTAQNMSANGGVTAMCIPPLGVLLPGRPADESLRIMQMRPEGNCGSSYQSWQRPSVDTPICEVHCESAEGAAHPFCQNATLPWNYNIMRCSDCEAAFCSPRDANDEAMCRGWCAEGVYFCTDASDAGHAECLDECVSSCLCTSTCRALKEDAALCAEQGGKWVNMNQNFDNLVVAFVSLFEICTTEGWVDLMLAAVDSRGPYLQPKRDQKEFTGGFIFVAFMLIGSFFVLNLCVGVIIDNYNKQKEESGHVMVTDAQFDWMAYQKALYLKRDFFVQVNIDRLGPSRQHRFRIITSSTFENTIMACIVMNTITLMMVWQPRATGVQQTFLDTCNLIFNIVFHFEAFMKLSALHGNYFREYWNIFDFICVFVGDVVSIVESMASDGGNLGLLVSALRIFRVARLFRLVRFLKGLNKLLLAFALSVPKLLNVGLVMILLLYLYVVLGVSLFAKVQYTGVGIYGPQVSFRNFYSAAITLLRSMTGEGWNEVMHDVSKDSYYYNSILSMRCAEMDLDNMVFSTLDLDGDGLVDNPTECGTALAFPYFISYTIVISFVILNLFIAVIFEGFEESSGCETKEVINKCLENWERYDAHNTMSVKLTKALDFIDETVEELMISHTKMRGSRVPETRWDPNSTTDMNASDQMWSLYNLHYVRTLGLKVRPDGTVRLVQCVKAIIRRVLISGGPHSHYLARDRRRMRVAELEALEMMMEEHDANEDLKEIRRMEIHQSKHLSQVLNAHMKKESIMQRTSHVMSELVAYGDNDEEEDPTNASEFPMLEKVAAAKIQRRAKESLQRRRDRARVPDTGSGTGTSRANDFGPMPINRAAG